MALLLGLAQLLLGILAGIYVATVIHDARIRDLSAAQYLAMHQMRDQSFAKVMPFLVLATLALTLAATTFALGSGSPRFLGAAAALLLAADIILTVRYQLPLNVLVQTWTPAATPEDWADVRDRWARHHNVRTILGLAAFASFIAATLLTLAR